jgi:hypothetical protein
MPPFKFTKKITPPGFNRTPRILTQQDCGDNADHENRLTIEATGTGIRIYGEMIGHLETSEELESFAAAVSSSWVDHVRLKTKMRDKLMGRR